MAMRASPISKQHAFMWTDQHVERLPTLRRRLQRSRASEQRLLTAQQSDADRRTCQLLSTSACRQQ